jgi:23S rRNA (guanosine2251-2'-O)-methyltransferase
VVKASAGATAHLPIVRVTNLVRSFEQLKKDGFWLVGTVADGGTSLNKIDLRGDIVLVIGSEGEGLRRIVSEACDFHANIPMAGKIGSLNASVAASICLYEALRQKHLP